MPCHYSCRSPHLLLLLDTRCSVLSGGGAQHARHPLACVRPVVAWSLLLSPSLRSPAGTLTGTAPTFSDDLLALMTGTFLIAQGNDVHMKDLFLWRSCPPEVGFEARHVPSAPCPSAEPPACGAPSALTQDAAFSVPGRLALDAMARLPPQLQELLLHRAHTHARMPE